MKLTLKANERENKQRRNKTSQRRLLLWFSQSSKKISKCRNQKRIKKDTRKGNNMEKVKIGNSIKMVGSLSIESSKSSSMEENNNTISRINIMIHSISMSNRINHRHISKIGIKELERMESEIK